MNVRRMLGQILRRADAEPPRPLIHVTAETYGPALADALADWTADAADRLRRLMHSLPEQTEAVDIGIHPDQDGEGFVAVMVHLQGPDLYALNRAVDAHRELFAVRATAQGRVPPVPCVNPFQEDFPTNDVIVDVATAWVLAVWAEAGAAVAGRSGRVFGQDGYGSSPSVRLP